MASRLRVELKVFTLVGQGIEPKDIAKVLGIQHRTVKKHLASLYKKHGIIDGCQIVKLAVLAYRESLKTNVSSL